MLFISDAKTFLVKTGKRNLFCIMELEVYELNLKLIGIVEMAMLSLVAL
jgi:hypothetical protein